jgi:hypothetical protein
VSSVRSWTLRRLSKILKSFKLALKSNHASYSRLFKAGLSWSRNAKHVWFGTQYCRGFLYLSNKSHQLSYRALLLPYFHCNSSYPSYSGADRMEVVRIVVHLFVEMVHVSGAPAELHS